MKLNQNFHQDKGKWARVCAHACACDASRPFAERAAPNPHTQNTTHRPPPNAQNPNPCLGSARIVVRRIT